MPINLAKEDEMTLDNILAKHAIRFDPTLRSDLIEFIENVMDDAYESGKVDQRKLTIAGAPDEG